MDERSVGLNCVNSTMRLPPNWREAEEDWGRCREADRYNPSRVRPTMSSHWASSICAKPKIECALLQHGENAEHDCRMLAIGLLFVRMLCDCFKPTAAAGSRNPDTATSTQRAAAARAAPSTAFALDRPRPKDAPCTRPIERFGDIIAQPILGGLHHRYARI